VDFHVSDLETTPGGGVPVALTVPVTATLVRMRGTDDGPPRCIALEGEIGSGRRCTIYDRSRPVPGFRALTRRSTLVMKAAPAHGVATAWRRWASDIVPAGFIRDS
jgi:hypothetical protein